MLYKAGHYWHQVDRLTGSTLAVNGGNDAGFHHVIPLQEILAEIHGTNADSKKVNAAFRKAIAVFGNEFSVLEETPVIDIDRFHPLLGKAISRMRTGQVKKIIPGYDNKYGKILLFDKAELTNGGIQQLGMF
jgi:PHP family Zn ribbon phosphoesterase